MSGNLRALLDSARNAKDEPEADEIASAVSPPKPAMTPKPQASALPKGKIGKYRDPAYEPVKIYIRSKQRKAASRKWEDAGGGDFSELIERLITEYLGS